MDKKKISLPIEFYVNSFAKEDCRDPKAGINSSIRIEMIDNKKKDSKSKDWTPQTSCYLNLIDIPDSIQFGKKYKITLEEI